MASPDRPENNAKCAIPPLPSAFRHKCESTAFWKFSEQLELEAPAEFSLKHGG
jgi:hypothetical protein